MSFAKGVPIETTTALPQATRDRIAQHLIDLTLQELLVFGQMQTDPNFANYLYDPNEQRIILLDFGAARRIDPGVAQNYKALLKAGLNGDVSAMEKTAQKLGFVDEDTSPSNRKSVVGMIQMVFEMVIEAEQVDFGAPDFARKMQVEGVRLAESGFIPPLVPIDVLLVQRKLGGVFLLAARLAAKIDLRTVIESILDRS